MNEEELRQLADAIRENTEMMRSLGVTQAAMARAQGINVKNMSDFDTAVKNSNASMKQSELYQKSAQQAAEKNAKANANYEAATNSAQKSVGAFAGAMMTTEKSLGKFGGSITAAGDAVWQLSKNFGLLGMAIGGLTKATTAVMDAALKQTDASLKATDQLSAMGAAGAFTAKEVLNMGHMAGLSSQNLEIFTKAAARANTGLSGFGNTVADGVKAFSQMTAVSKEQRMAFERMGISQEQLMAMQGDYIKLQEMSGISMKGQAQDAGKLKKESLEYVENLTRLSAMTGKSADKLAKEQEAQQMEYEELIQVRQEEDKIRELKAQGRDKEAESLKLEQQKRKAYLQEIEQVYGKDMALKAGRLSRTGSYDKSTASLAVLGIDPNRIQSDIKNAKDLDAVRRNAAGFNQEVKSLQSESLKSFGTALQYRGEELGNKLGVTKESIATSSKYMDRNELAAYEAAKRQTGTPSTGQTSATTANDPAQISRNFATESGIALREGIDKAVLAMNPLMSGFNSTTIAATALTAAAMAAAGALSMMALKSSAGGLLSMGTNNALGGMGRFGGLLKGIGGKALGGIGGLVGGVALDFAGSKAAEAGHHKTAAGLDTASYALKGAGLGALLGPMGALAGGALGGAYGLYQNWGKFGSSGGASVASSPASDAKIKEESDKIAQRDKDQTKATKDLDISSKEGNKKLDLNTQSIDRLSQAIEDLTTVTTIHDATGTREQKDAAMAAIYARRGIGAAGPESQIGAYQGGGAVFGGGASSSPAPTPKAAGPAVSNIQSSEAQLKEAGLILKKGDVQAPGAGLDPRLIEIAKKVQAAVPGFVQFTGFNDQFHNEKAPSSQHTKGKAFDFVVSRKPTKEEGANVISLMKSLGIDYAIDEYNNPSAGATAGHFHGQLQAYDGGIFSGPSAGYSVELHGREAIVPLPNPDSKISIENPAEKQPLSTVMSNSGTTDSAPMNDMMVALMEEFKEMMETKFDDMIDTMKENNSISDKILTYTKA